MKKLLFSMAFLGFAFTSQAQWQADGSTLSGTLTMTDLNSNSIDAFTLLNQGKHLIIDFSATWCGPCWNYHQTKVLDNYYVKNGPNGTYIKDAQVVLYETDPNTTLAALQGIGGSTQGDWITGTSHPICNPSSSSAVLQKFLVPGTTSFGVPAVFVVCNDKKFYKISTTIITEPSLRSYIAGKCGLGPLSNSEVIDLGFTYDIFPNPANDQAIIRLNLENSNTVSYALKNSLGQTVVEFNNQQIQTGLNELKINTSNLSNGLYFVNLSVGQRNINARIVVAH